jgi:hypothetical protein
MRWLEWVRRLPSGISGLVRDREDGRHLAALRIGVSVVFFGSLFEMLRTGTVEAIWMRPGDGGIFRTTPYLWTWKTILPDPKPATVYGLAHATCALAVAVAAGIGGRVAVLLLLLAYYSLRSLNPPSTGGYDALLVNALIFMLLAPVTRTWSVDCWLKNRKWSSEESVPSWPRYVFVFQLVILYFATGLKKASVIWSPAGGYSALYYIMMDVTWVRFDSLEFLRDQVFLTRMGTAVTWHWEHLAPILLFAGYFRRTRDEPGRIRRWFNRYDMRIPYVLVGFGVHAGIAVVTAVGPFSAVTLALYPSLFGPRELDDYAQRVRETWSRLRSRRSSDGGRS